MRYSPTVCSEAGSLTDSQHRDWQHMGTPRQ
jgi:hypothetical protein